jgi:hypothetical protein
LTAKAQNRKVLGFFAVREKSCCAVAFAMFMSALPGVSAHLSAQPLRYRMAASLHGALSRWRVSRSEINDDPCVVSRGRSIMIDGLVAGRLYGDAEQRIDKAGKPFTVAKVRANTADGETLFVNVIAFEASVCAALRALLDGDSLALTGSITPRVWTDKQGVTKPALDMVAQRILAVQAE